MARINVEDSLFKLRGWTSLVVALGDRERALGALVWAWITAQRFWFPDRKLIPRQVWDDEGLCNAIIDAGLADESELGIYVQGSESQFKWLFDQQAKGVKSGEARRKRLQTTVEPQLTPAIQDQPTRSSFSSSSSCSKENPKNAKPHSLKDSASDGTPEAIHPAEILDASLRRSEELQEIQSIVAQAFESTPPPRMKSKTTQARILLKFGSPQSFADYINAVLAEPKAQPDNQGWRTYVEGRIWTQIKEAA